MVRPGREILRRGGAAPQGRRSPTRAHPTPDVAPAGGVPPGGIPDIVIPPAGVPTAEVPAAEILEDIEEQVPLEVPEDRFARGQSYRRGHQGSSRGRGTRGSAFPRPPYSATASCFICGQVGHMARQCPRVLCYTCGERGHISLHCPSASIQCYKCGFLGHKAAACPQRRAPVIAPVIAPARPAIVLAPATVPERVQAPSQPATDRGRGRGGVQGRGRAQAPRRGGRAYAIALGQTQFEVEEMDSTLSKTKELTTSIWEKGHDLKIEYHNGQEIQLTSFTIENPQYRASSIISMKVGRRNNITPNCLGSYKTEVYFSKPDLTLRQFLDDPNYLDTYWYSRGKNANDTEYYRMGSMLRELIKTLIRKFSKMIDLKLEFKQGLDAIALNKTLEPQILASREQSKGTCTPPKKLWEEFYDQILSKFIEKARVQYCDKMHPEVEEFARMFKLLVDTCPERMSIHPALLSEQERFRFLLRIRDKFKEGKGYKLPKKDEYRNWRVKLEKTEAKHNFGDMLAFLRGWRLRSDGSEIPSNDHISYISFIRDFSVHRRRLTNYNSKRLFRDFDSMHPKFVSYVFYNYVTCERGELIVFYPFFRA